MDASELPLMNEATRRFVAEHADGDVRQLALQSRRWPEVNMPLALDQIAGRQTARRKLPRWAAMEGILYPPHLAMEQCSSEATADYKAALLTHGERLVDLTGGFGVDCAAMSSRFNRVTYVERQATLCRIARHNFGLLGLHHIEVVNGDGVEWLHIMPDADVIYLDPARRDSAGRRTYGIADCTPDVSALASHLLAKAPMVLVKLSPMLDVRRTLTELPSVSALHIVSSCGDCKELLAVMRRAHTGTTTIHCACDGNVFSYDWGSSPPAVQQWDGCWHEGLHLFEPNPSMMKAGCFNHVAARYGMRVVSRDSHLLTGDTATRFPGRRFAVDAVVTMNKGEVRRLLADVTQANVAVRNFPLRAADLARRLHVKDGGGTYIFGTTTAAGKHVLLRCHAV